MGLLLFLAREIQKLQAEHFYLLQCLASKKACLCISWHSQNSTKFACYNRIYSSIAQSVERRTVKSAVIGKPPNLLQKSRLNSTTYKAYST